MSLVFVQSASDISTVESEFGDAGLVISKKYNRISTDTRDSLLAKIFFENKKIKIVIFLFFLDEAWYVYNR